MFVFVISKHMNDAEAHFSHFYIKKMFVMKSRAVFPFTSLFHVWIEFWCVLAAPFAIKIPKLCIISTFLFVLSFSNEKWGKNRWSNNISLHFLKSFFFFDFSTFLSFFNFPLFQNLVWTKYSFFEMLSFRFRFRFNSLLRQLKNQS